MQMLNHFAPSGILFLIWCTTNVPKVVRSVKYKGGDGTEKSNPQVDTQEKSVAGGSDDRQCCVRIYELINIPGKIRHDVASSCGPGRCPNGNRYGYGYGIYCKWSMASASCEFGNTPAWARKLSLSLRVPHKVGWQVQWKNSRSAENGWCKKKKNNKLNLKCNRNFCFALDSEKICY